MCSAFRIDAGRCGGLVAALAAGLNACSPSYRPAISPPTSRQSGPPVVVSGLFPGGTPRPPEDPRGPIYDGNAAYIAQGKHDFTSYNCSGCHFNGGGGIGPSFMDKVWRYGGRIDQIHNSVADGRPNGMPAWGDKIPDAQIWAIAAYVRSLSTPQARSDETASPRAGQLPATLTHLGGNTAPGPAA